MKFALNTVVWGRPYVHNLLQVSLPTLFSEGNLLGNGKLDRFVYQLMTTEEDHAALRKAPIFRRLSDLVEMDVRFIDHIRVDRSDATHKYNRVSIAQTEGMQRARDTGCGAIFFLYPDFIYSTGCLAGIAERLDIGHCAVLCPIPFVSREAVLGGAMARYGTVTETDRGTEVSLEPRQMVRLNLDHPHPVNLGFDVAHGRYGEWPGVFIWSVPDEGQLIRSFHLHPIAILLPEDDPRFYVHFEVSIDDEFMSRVYLVDDNFAHVTDSDDFAMCSLRGETEPPHTMPGYRSDPRRAALWAEEFTGTLLRHFLKTPFFWHHADLTESAWAERVRQSAAFADQVRYRLQVPDMVLQIEDPEAFAARRRRKRHFVHKNRAAG